MNIKTKTSNNIVSNNIVSKEYKLKLPCMKCGMVERHLNTPHWKCPNLKKYEPKKK